MADIPYEPVIRDRVAERARVEQVPGYSEARHLPRIQRTTSCPGAGSDGGWNW
jgi:hypothetical protein